ncbi:MAG: replication endonuclease [Campylobacteraceae bacterium]|jgi:hypothetical protein|nr:replication endonuclease [Campylobacteraceae bacterium]
MIDYGLSEMDRNFVINKLKYQQNYLNENFYDTGFEKIPYALFFRNAWHNSQRYIAELNHRIYSLNQYADERCLKPIFAVLTLPSEYHCKKTIRLKNGKTKLVKNPKFIDDEFHSVKAGSQQLSAVIRSIFNQRIFRSIALLNKCYVTTREPHKDGTCHLNLLVFVPSDKVEKCVNAIKNCFIDKHSRVETAINNPTAYVMKYIFKTLDDLRNHDGDLSKLSNLTLWYIKHKIPRVTTSKTFISLDVYRILKGQYDIKTLTYMYKSGRIQILLDHNNKIVQIFDDFGEIYQHIRINKVSYECKNKPSIGFKSKFESNPNGNKPPYKMTDLELFEHFYGLDIDAVNLHYYAACNNELARRNFNVEKVPMNYFNTDFNVEGFEDEF